MRLIIAIALLFSPGWTFQAGNDQGGFHLTPLSHPVSVGDTFTLHLTTDWTIGETAPMTITLDPRVKWTTIAGNALCTTSRSRIICPEPSYEWVTVEVTERGDPQDVLVFLAEYEGDQKVVTVPMMRQTYLPVIYP